MLRDLLCAAHDTKVQVALASSGKTGTCFRSASTFHTATPIVKDVAVCMDALAQLGAKHAVGNARAVALVAGTRVRARLDSTHGDMRTQQADTVKKKTAPNSRR